MTIILDADDKIFVVHVLTLAKLIIISIYPFREAQIALLTSTEIFAEYSNFLDIFFSNFAVELPKYIRMNNHLINLLEDKQSPIARYIA